MNRSDENYASRGGLAVTALLAVLVAVSFIPPQSIGGVKLRRANILSELLSFDDASGDAHRLEPVEELSRIDLDSVAGCIAATDTLPTVKQLRYAWRLPADSLTAADAAPFVPVPDSVRRSPALIPIEDFSAAGDRMEAFYDTLLHARRPVRIAFLGDSFVEGDILTADLREQLQLAYGGGGTGFAPVASPLTSYRRSVKTQSKGWTAYNIMQRKNAPESAAGSFFVSGWVCQAAAGASTAWTSTDFRRQLTDCNEAHLLFISPSDSRIEVTLNDTLRNTFAVEGDRSVRDIVVSAPCIRSLAFRVAAGERGFVGYGALFGAERGVEVDNYSVRSNNGRALFWTNPSVNAQVHALVPYDLVILQYGLNIMQQGVRAYGRYGEQLDQMIAFVRECFPGAAVLLLGVSDRSVKTENGFEPMDAVPYLTDCQRAAAQRAGAAFWPTGEAMRSWGGMESFVANGWAGKDYTHINYEGGRRVAWSLADALHAGARAVYLRHEALHSLPAAGNVLDSLQRELLRTRMQPERLPAAPRTVEDAHVRRNP